jgi:hypothetical protein
MLVIPFIGMKDESLLKKLKAKDDATGRFGEVVYHTASPGAGVAIRLCTHICAQ